MQTLQSTYRVLLYQHVIACRYHTHSLSETKSALESASAYNWPKTCLPSFYKLLWRNNSSFQVQSLISHNAFEPSSESARLIKLFPTQAAMPTKSPARWGKLNVKPNVSCGRQWMPKGQWSGLRLRGRRTITAGLLCRPGWQRETLRIQRQRCTWVNSADFIQSVTTQD